jgi:signal transduction histidine kinase
MKYMRPNTPPRIEVESRKMGNSIQIFFKDNGLGFDQRANNDQVFHLYRRFHNHVEGKGIGLFVVKQHVEALGGKISVQSKVNQGAEFIIDLPL